MYITLLLSARLDFRLLGIYCRHIVNIYRNFCIQNTVPDNYASAKLAFLNPRRMQFRKIHIYQMINHCLESK